MCDKHHDSRNELIGTHARRLIRSDYHQVFQQFMKDLDRTRHFNGETVDVRKNGTPFNADIRGAKIQFNGQEGSSAIIIGKSIGIEISREWWFHSHWTIGKRNGAGAGKKLIV